MELGFSEGGTKPNSGSLKYAVWMGHLRIYGLFSFCSIKIQCLEHI